MKARWERCTPAWVQAHPDSCGPTIRRPIIELCKWQVLVAPLHAGLDVKHFHVVSHEHLVDARTGLPIEHVDGRPT